MFGIKRSKWDLKIQTAFIPSDPELGSEGEADWINCQTVLADEPTKLRRFYTRSKASVMCFVQCYACECTHLTKAIGITICGQLVRNCITTVCELSNILIKGSSEKSLKRAINHFSGYGLMIVNGLCGIFQRGRSTPNPGAR